MLKQMYTFCALLLSLLIHVRARNTISGRVPFLYRVSESFRPGWPLHVALTAPNSSDEKVSVRVSLLALTNVTSEILAADTTITPGETQLLKLQVPKILPLAKRFTFMVYTTTGEDYVSSHYLQLIQHSTVALVQTDRTNYKPGQKVLFRVIHLAKDLRPSAKPLNVTIFDPKDTKIEFYRNVASSTGVTPLQFQLPKSPTLGSWTMTVDSHIDDQPIPLHTAFFKVEDYGMATVA
ncbi:alpha-2-macroglobulin [Plakobranchus ocellatus]|uniref:Alpha-2-macroglobulin n=1 Tax=Plakobranchus ocellatus TaxID=259542 RepID=A0AAV3ZCF7_9GAST|nr:alpha-2-macroglobulin [Plakobranchus ocellatus]